MKFNHSVRTALTGLHANRSRSALTILGIVIGITAIILIVSLGKGAQTFILGQIQGIGSKTIAVIPGRQPTGPSDFANVFLDSLKDRDLKSISNKANVPFAENIMPVVFGTTRLSFGNETYQATVLGAGNDEKDNVIGQVFDVYPSTGDFFTATDVKSLEKVAVLGDKVKKELFGSEEALGQKVKISNTTFRIVGILPKKGQVSFFNFDDMVLVPYTTAQQYVLGKKYFDRFIVTADKEEHISRTVRDVELTIRANHSITDPDKDDFFVETQADIAERLRVVTNALTAFLVSVAAISLFVGGVGIMNIMLVSVTERTKEIGLRKAIGATDQDILTQFLFEAIILTGIGGVIGIILGAFFSFTASLLLTRILNISWTFTFPYGGTLIGLTVSIGIGLIFGIYPARQAAKKNPIDALRYE
ncbi:MAG: ABC transporter permease [Patescibacteria group bacterium]